MKESIVNERTEYGATCRYLVVSEGKLDRTHGPWTIMQEKRGDKDWPDEIRYGSAPFPSPIEFIENLDLAAGVYIITLQPVMKYQRVVDAEPEATVIVDRLSSWRFKRSETVTLFAASDEEWE